ncbi:MAG: TspO/MBR family protein [Microscillaceae bacterium]
MEIPEKLERTQASASASKSLPTGQWAKPLGKLVLSLGMCLLVGFLASYATQSSVDSWYPTLQKPAFNPPNWVFAPVWISLYVMMGLSFFFVWNRGGSQKRIQIALAWFLVQLVLNAAWSFVFFGWQSPFWGLLDISLLFVVLIITIILFFRVSRWGGLLLLPYLFWVGFAAILNYTIWILN